MGEDTRAIPEEGRFVRPYAITGGRTSASTSTIDLEAQVTATEHGRASQRRYRWEAATVLSLCQEPIAVVELAARMAVPIDVVRVVVADLVGDGALTIHAVTTETSYTELLERVLDGIRQL